MELWSDIIMVKKTIDEYIKEQNSPQKEICQTLRELILKIYPSIKEEMKYGVPYFGNKFYIVALKEYVNLGFSIEGLTKEQIGLFEGSGKTTRHIKIRTKEDIVEDNLKKLMDIVKKIK
ncbi:MAG: hypothetical protein GF311_08440 [Candidatus Lokiarchaeota archaeon]|nr:hypothetical protein [Candidatus Lokiarchaeota archaeon]